VLERPLAAPEREEIVAVFCRVGQRMGVPDLPAAYAAWQEARRQHLAHDLAPSRYTADLYRQYRRHLGAATGCCGPCKAWWCRPACARSCAWAAARAYGRHWRFTAAPGTWP